MFDRKPVKSSERQPRKSMHRGIATLWVILVVPLIITMICGVTDMALLLNAKVELKTALEAAALKGAETWGGDHVPGGGATDSQAARDDAIEMAGANMVNGVPVVLSDNYTGANTNDNTNCDGELVFGAIDIAGDPHTFNAGIVPVCDFTSGATTEIRSTLNFQSQKVMGTLTTFKALTAGMGMGGNEGFSLTYDFNDTGSVPPGLTVDAITIQLPAGVTFNPGPNVDGTSPVDAEDEVSNAGLDGWGPILLSAPAGTTVAFSPGPTDAPSNTITLTFGGATFDATEKVQFGIDTDGATGVAVDGDTADSAADFNASDLTITWAMSNAVSVPYSFDDGVSFSTSSDAGQVFLTNGLGGDAGVVIVGTGEFAVMAKKTIQVESLWKTLFGLNVGPYPVYAKAIAVADCPDGVAPQLMHATTILCP